jgi:hypothetical protein
MAPATAVKEAMGTVKAAQRQRVAAWEQGEADKVRCVCWGGGGGVGGGALHQRTEDWGDDEVPCVTGTVW